MYYNITGTTTNTNIIKTKNSVYCVFFLTMSPYFLFLLFLFSHLFTYNLFI